MLSFRDGDTVNERQLLALAVVALIVIYEAVGWVAGSGAHSDAAAEGHLAGAGDTGQGAVVVSAYEGVVVDVVVVVAVADGSVGVVYLADDGAEVLLAAWVVDGERGADDVAVLHGVGAAAAATADEGAEVGGCVIAYCGPDAGTDEDDVAHSGSFNHAKETEIAVVFADAETTDDVAQPVVGALEGMTGADSADGVEIAAAAQVDVGCLAEGLVAADVAGGFDGCREVAQVCLVGDGHLRDAAGQHKFGGAEVSLPWCAVVAGVVVVRGSRAADGQRLVGTVAVGIAHRPRSVVAAGTSDNKQRSTDRGVAGGQRHRGALLIASHAIGSPTDIERREDLVGIVDGQGHVAHSVVVLGVSGEECRRTDCHAAGHATQSTDGSLAIVGLRRNGGQPRGGVVVVVVVVRRRGRVGKFACDTALVVARERRLDKVVVNVLAAGQVSEEATAVLAADVVGDAGGGHATAADGG